MKRKQEHFYINDWLIQPELNQISKKGKAIVITPKEMEVLIYLAAHQAQVISRDELLEQVWAGTIVSDNAMVRVVANLRKAMGDDWQSPAYIETISKSGYRLIAEVKGLRRERPTKRSTLKTTLNRKRLSLMSFLLLILIVLNWSFIRSPERPLIHNPVPLTSLKGLEIPGALSPDGKWLSFLWAGPDGDNWNLYVQLIGTEGMRQLTNEPGEEMFPAWSSDGKYIAYVSTEGQQCGIFRMTLLGEERVRLCDCISDDIAGLDWSPDGEWLAFTERPEKDRPVAVVLYNLKSGEKNFLTTPKQGNWGDLEPAFSPEGKQLAFRRIASEGVQEVYVVDIQSGQAEQLTNESRMVRGVSWVNDGKELLYASTDAGRWGLWRISAKGGTAIKVPVASGTATSPVTSASDKGMAFMEYSANSDIWQITQGQTGTAEPLISSAFNDEHPAISNKGDRIAFISDRTGDRQLWTAKRDGSEAIKVTDFDGGFVSSPVWSPNDDLILFERKENGHTRPYVIHSMGGVVRPLTDGHKDLLNAEWTGENREIIYTQSSEDKFRAYKSILSEDYQIRDTEMLTDQPIFKAQLAGDGHTLYYVKYGEDGIWKMDIRGEGTEELVIKDLHWFDWPNWKLLDEGIYFVRRENVRICFYNFQEEAITKEVVLERSVPQFFPALTVSNGGGEVLFTSTGERESNIMWVAGFK